MKNQIKKLYTWALKLVPVCATAMMIATANTTTCWLKGQEEPPANTKKFRKF